MNGAIDIHAHAVFPQLQQIVSDGDAAGLAAAQTLEARRNGAESLAASATMIRDRFEQLTNLPRRLADMDAASVAMQVVSPSPSHYYPFLDAQLAETVAKTANRAISDLVALAPDRLNGLGLIALQHPHLAVELLEHAVNECGLLGVEISSFAPGADRSIELSDDRLEPFWARAEELGAIVFLHPFGCSLDERLDRYYLANTVGQPVENAVALSHLIFSGVLDRHPRLVLVAAHGGGYLPTFLGRSDHAWLMRPEARVCANPPSSYLKALYFDSLVHSPNALVMLVEAAGADRILMGSDYPFDMGVSDPVERIRAAGLEPAEIDAITVSNAAVLGIGRHR